MTGKSKRRSFDSLRCASVAQDDSIYWEVGLCFPTLATKTRTSQGWGTQSLSSRWRAEKRLHARAGDVFVLDLQRLFGFFAGEVVGVPDDTFAGDLGMLAQEL